MKLLLDSNAYGQLLRGEKNVANLVRDAERLVFSTVVLGELLAGFHAGTKLKDNLQRLERFVNQPQVTMLPVTWETADRFGRVFAALRRKGRPIPTNDIWIAAHALEAGAYLVSFDRHFEEVEGLVWLNPGIAT
jgi:tRNA(fMet)-specific endonuclease VapC